MNLKYYALKRKERNPEKYKHLNLFDCQVSELLDLIESLQKNKKMGETLRFQCILSSGHTTTLDIQIDDKNKSIIILDSIDEISYALKPVIEKLIQQDFDVFIAHSTVPNKPKHSVFYITPDCTKYTETNIEQDIMSNPMPYQGKHFYFIKKAQTESSPEQWLYFCRENASGFMYSINKITIRNQVVTDRSLLLALNNLPRTTEIAPLEKDTWTDLLLESSLQPFNTLPQQKDMYSCKYFALHHAIQAGKTPDLHSICQGVKNTDPPHFLCNNAKQNLVTENPGLASITYIPWDKLPKKFGIWSQSHTFFQESYRTPDAPKENIREGMNSKMGKFGLPPF